MVILQAAETWVALSLVIFFGILGYFGVHRIVLGYLDKRADGIRDRIEDARRLREEAGEEVERYEREQKEAQNAHDSAMEQARQDAALAHEAMLKDYRESLERRLEAAEQRIQQAEESAQREVQNKGIDVAVAVASEVIGELLGDDERARLASRGIEQIGASL